ncbi:MAG: hypothetical protein Q8927_16635 [Bacteroidota bacterium]|nr:hypothetical protein [Bacteroidota bacterium]MDP4245253.1 hypothetical protein [Bacteroidota bacterium]MDP4255875.1 hypothetical protein [Bacteroidota bacterium]MDP4260291.1 hypothetical protein [Bacteroidota bacterium]
MARFIFLIFFVFATAATSSLHAQTIANTSWKTYIEQLNDTLTLHFRQDSSFVTTGSGTVVVRSHWKVSADTVTLDDYDGEYACINMLGKYKLEITGDMLHFALIEDACEGRAGSLSNARWKKSPEK